MKRIEGLFVATVTPFTDSGALDEAGYRAHCRWLLAEGADGLTPCGTTGESPTLSAEERRMVITIAVEEARAAKKTVIAGCGGNDTNKVLAALEEAKQLGADSALVVTPYYNKPTQEGLLAHYRALADRGALPVVLYHVPGRTGTTFEAATVHALLAHDRILGIKEASGNYAFWTKLVEGFPFEKKALLAGDDDAIAVLCAYGGSGAISASANVAPARFAALCAAGREGRWADAFAEQRRLLPLVRLLFSETNPAPAKAALARLGRMENQLRLPLVAVRPETEARIGDALRGLELLS